MNPCMRVFGGVWYSYHAIIALGADAHAHIHTSTQETRIMPGLACPSPILVLVTAHGYL